MINAIVEWSLKNRIVVIAIYIGIAAFGYWTLLNTPVDAIPDVSDNQVIVFTDWTGRSPQEIEDQVTYPLVTNLQGLPGVKVVRANSAFGFSMINVIFEDSVELYWARTRILERLNVVRGQLPTGVTPMLGPDASGVGQVFWYTLESEKMSLRELRTIQDWFVRYQLNSVKGVSEVATVGGYAKQYQINVDPESMRAYELPMSKVIEAVKRSNSNVGGNVLEENGEWSVVRGVGLIESVQDVENIVVDSRGGTPIFMKNIAEVEIGDAFRVGALDKNGKEAVGGVVIARYGENTPEVIEATKQRIEEIQIGLPEGVTIVPFYDRSELVKRATNTLTWTLIEELILVTLVHILFLFHFRSILIVSIPLPLSVLMAFSFMYFAGISSNIMSLSGIAIAIGVLVDAGIVVTENAFRYIEKNGVDTKDRSAVFDAVLKSTRLVARPVFFSMTIIIFAFLPVFALQGREGKLFHPLAFTKTFAMIAATIISVTLVPVLCTYLLGGKVHSEAKNPGMNFLRKIYEPVLRFALSRRLLTLILALIIFIGGLFLVTRIGTEFMPNLNEGDLMYMPITDPAISLDEALRIAQRQDKIIESIPEVEYAVGKVGRAETPTDPAPINMNETVIHLKPESEWRSGVTRESLVNELDSKLRFPGVTNIWTQPIINRIEMLSTGIRSELGVKIFGSDLEQLEKFANLVADELKTVEGARDVYPEKVIGTPYVDIDIDRKSAARYGIDVAMINGEVENAIGETNITTSIEGRERIPIRVRFKEKYRKDISAIENLPIITPSGTSIPLAQLATVRRVNGASMIQSENGLLKATVLVNVRGRDIGSFVNEANKTLRENLELPIGYYFVWSGQFENQQRARTTLIIVIPIVMIIIFFLLYFTYGSALEAGHVLMAIPFALSGGVYLQWLLGYNFSVAVWVGYIALFGTAVQTGVVMVIYLEEAVEKKREELGILSKRDLMDAVIDGALLRLRPKVMTVTTIVAGLLPIMWSTSTGSEVIKPIATPVLGGMVSSVLHVLIVTPVVFYLIHSRNIPGDARAIDAPINVSTDFGDNFEGVKDED